MPHGLESVYEVVSIPGDFFSLLPIEIKLKSFRGSDVVVYINAFGIRGDVVFSFVVSKGTNRAIVESSLIGELVMGFFRPPRMDLSFRLVATRADGETEISFELYVRAGSFKERISGITAETERFISRIPENITEALKRAVVKPAAEAKHGVAVVPKPPTAPVVSEGATPVGVEEKEEKPEVAPATATPKPPVEAVKPVGRGVSDTYLSILEDPIAVYRLTIGGKSVSTLRMKYSDILINTLFDISTKNDSPIYVVLRSEKQTARLIVIKSEILGVVVEYENNIIKGDKALELLEKSGEEFLCAIFTVSKELLDSLKQS
ncbi:MAG: hypothetical protein RMI56_05980 [Sulfolobales archaeon]|nr:hypothetical protein [Sulfolobales archaeon]MDW8083325.1 hypothetical protein [Sulfolobales archaeon]